MMEVGSREVGLQPLRMGRVPRGRRSVLRCLPRGEVAVVADPGALALAASVADAEPEEIAMLTYTGPFTVYFNRHCDAPLVWIVAAQDRAWEVNVVSVAILVPVVTRYEPRPQSPDHNGPPSAWFEGEGLVQIDQDGRATIFPSP